jgi:hypothetical protein
VPNLLSFAAKTGSGNIRPAYRANFRAQGNLRVGSFIEDFFAFVKFCPVQSKGCWKESY